MTDIKYNKGITTISTIVEKYKKNGRFTEEMVQSVTEAIDGQDLKIAVIGKMKAGKSSFINALIFHGDVLPSGPEPTTVTLTEIAYTNDPSKDSRVEVELLTLSDIDDLKSKVNSENAQVANNAHALLDSINNIPGGYENLISKGIVEIELDELIKFTSTEGDFSGLAKKVTIYKHLDVLKGLRLTDTPGFNDPVTSRGEATKNALKDCHIILFVHDYLDKYDQDEIAILLEQVEYSGVSMLVDVINKMDANEDLALPLWATYIPKFDKKKDEAIKQIPKEGIKELLSRGQTGYVSALMALIGYEVAEYNQKKKDGTDCKLSEEIKEFYVKYQSDFSELRSADDFIKYSNIAGIVEIINQLSAEKNKYLANYPIQTLIGHLKSLNKTVSGEIKSKQQELDAIKQNAAEATRQIDAINEMFKALGSSINSPLLASTLRDCIRDTKHEIQRVRDNISSNEFTSANYEKEGHLFTSGPEERNLSRYKGVLTDFDKVVRDKLKDLKDAFGTKCEEYIYKLVRGLDVNTVELKDRENLAEILICLLRSEIGKGLPIVVNPDEPTSCLYGAGTQYSLYKSDFLQRRSDNALENNYLKIFRSFVDGTISSDVLRDAITEQIESLKTKLKGAIKYSPAEKEEEIKKLTKKIKELKIELHEINLEVQSLEQLK